MAQPQATPAEKTPQATTANAQSAEDAAGGGREAPSPVPQERFNGTSDQDASEIVVTGRMRSANGVTNTTPGGGLMADQMGTKLRSTVTRDYIDKQIPLGTAFTLIKNLPGVVFASSEAFTGASAGTSFLTIRGLSQNSLGFNFEGMPVGDQLSYSAYPGEWSDSENIGLLNLTRGSTDITAPVYNSVGALLQQEMIAPSHRTGGFASASVGNHNMTRLFLRLDSGDIGNTGARGFLSFSRTESDNWRGPGKSRRHHLDSKIVKDWGDHNVFSLVATYNEEKADQLRFPTLAQWNASGRDFNFLDTYTPGNTNYYKLRIADRQSLYVSAPTTIALADSVDLVTTPYFLYTHGYGNGASTLSLTNSFYGTTPAGQLQVPTGTANPATVMNIDTYDQKTYGQNSYLKWNVDKSSQIRVGYWYSHFAHDELSAYELVDATGSVSDPYGRSEAILTSSGEVLRGFTARFRQNLNGIYIDDTTKLLNDRLLLNVGFKQVWIDRTATNILPGATSPTSSRHSVSLPQGSIRYGFDDDNRNQLFADITTAFRAPSSISSYIDIFNVATGQKSSIASPEYKIEYTVGEEFGFRHLGLVNFTIAIFNYDLSNRQVQGTQVVNGNNVGFAVNVGKQTARGIEAEIGLRPWRGFSPYASAQYLDARAKSDYPLRGDFLPTTGKRAVLSPEIVAAAGLTFDDGHFFANIDVNYSGEQFSTFMNDEVLPAYTVANAGIGYRFDRIGPARRPQIQLSVANVTDTKYLSGIRGVQPNAVATTGRNGTVIPASSPTYFIGGGIGAVLRIGTAF